MLDANGYLTAFTNPELETTSFTYTTDDLLLAKTDARQNSSTVTYIKLSACPIDKSWREGVE
ncbi:hypothetical protein NITGR_440005 [Nitrospina gracilis 3/211]|uniref:Uncharacterized protein n=1 Tax=Nitrospina gracilis (strain 3/211) TaxID=1266370 RepID=M1YZE3_NITG3|nr:MULTISPECIES: hypothetical protein [Nitrospina]MCF8723759.1 YD repeat-containing protein [Nitrospina sp. Nb-3]CCQ90865.1 hypothetical protein NITGR_440005 [Nitrospina gracilis 3/211]